MQRRRQSSPTLHLTLHKPAGKQGSTAGCRQTSAAWCWAGGGHRAVPLPGPCPSIPAALARPPGRPGHPGSLQAPQRCPPHRPINLLLGEQARPFVCQDRPLVSSAAPRASALLLNLETFAFFPPRTRTACVQQSQPAQPRCRDPFQNRIRPALAPQPGADPTISTRTRPLATDTAGAIPRCLPPPRVTPPRPLCTPGPAARAGLSTTPQAAPGAVCSPRRRGPTARLPKSHVRCIKAQLTSAWLPALQEIRVNPLFKADTLKN